jgi:transposase
MLVRLIACLSSTAESAAASRCFLLAARVSCRTIMPRTAPQISVRRACVKAVQNGASVAATARRYGVPRSTLDGWLRAYDPAHPVASLRPGKRGPKAPRWPEEALDFVVELIGNHQIGPLGWVPIQWGRHRIALALADRGFSMSEATVSRMLPVARELVAQKHAQEACANEARSRREMRTAARRAAQEAERRQMWKDRLANAMSTGLTGIERLQRIADALASKVWKMKVSDLTPELEALADQYLANAADYIKEAEARGQDNKIGWLKDAHRWVSELAGAEAAAGLPRSLGTGPNIDNLRVGALSSLIKNFKSENAADLSPIRRLPKHGQGDGS